MDAKLTRMLLIIMTFGARVQSISTSRSVLHVTWTRNRENIEVIPTTWPPATCREEFG